MLHKKYKLDPKRAENISFLADGNLREAIMMVEEVDDNYSEVFRNLMLACFKNDLNEASKIIDDLAKNIVCIQYREGQTHQITTI